MIGSMRRQLGRAYREPRTGGIASEGRPVPGRVIAEAFSIGILDVLAHAQLRPMPTGNKAALQTCCVGALLQHHGLNAITQTAVTIRRGVQFTGWAHDMTQGDYPCARAETRDSAGELLGKTLLDR